MNLELLDSISHENIPAAILRLSARLVAEAPEPPRAYLLPEEAADLLRVSKRWVYRHAKELGAVTMGTAVRIPIASLDRYLARRGAASKLDSDSKRRAKK